MQVWGDRKATAGSSTPLRCARNDRAWVEFPVISFDRLLLRVQWMLGVFEELVLQLEAFVIGLDGLDSFSDLA